MNPIYDQARINGVRSRDWDVFAEPMSRLNNVEIHGTVFFGFGSYINSGSIRSWVEVGRYSSIGRDVSLGLGHHNMSAFSTSSFFEDAIPHSPFPPAQDNPLRRCMVGNDCWIGDKVLLLSGIKIGDGAVCAAGAVVTRDVMPYEIVGGVPAKHIGWRFGEETCRRLVDLKWWNYEPSLVRDLAAPDVHDFLDACESSLLGAEIFPIKFRHYRADDPS